MFRNIVMLFIVISLASCSNNKTSKEDPATIVQECIKTHGGEAYKNMDVQFTFRDKTVRLMHNNGLYSYERRFTDSSGKAIEDVLTNSGFVRKINGEVVSLSEKEVDSYREATNSIAYFMLLPYKLSEPAVQLRSEGSASIGDNIYDKVGVSFSADGGGKDHEDEFCFWINAKTHTMDYLSYANGGPRFRKATKRDTVGGIIFQNYENYQVLDTIIHPSQYDSAHEKGNSKLLSVIEQTDYKNNLK